jgi:hypothetical protein
MQNLVFTPEKIDGFEVNRCYQGKIQTQGYTELGEALWLTHKLFNHKVAEVCRHIFRVLNNKSNPEFACLTRWAIENITPAGQCSTHFANPFTLAESRANPTHNAYNKNEPMRELFRLCKERGDRWYDRNVVFGTLIQKLGGGSGMVAEVNQAAIEKISGHLALMKNWREGKETPLLLLEEDLFIKKLTKFLKENRDILAGEWQAEIDNESTEKDTELYEILISNHKKQQADLLRDLYRHRLQNGWLLDELNRFYQQYNNETLGKENWLKQKALFEKTYPVFQEEYKRLLDFYKDIFKAQRETKPPESLPSHWFRDPNLLSLLHAKGGEIWPGFCSPLSDEAFNDEWSRLREKADLPEKPWDDRQGRDFFIEALKSLNPELFKNTGWFKIFERYTQFQRFARPPQFRYPDPVKHPDWLNFSEGGCFKYRTPKVIGPARLEITVKLIDPKNPTSWKDYTLEVALDQRLSTLGERQSVQVPDGRWVKTLDGQRIFEWNKDDSDNPLYKKDEFYPWRDSEGVIQWIQIHGGNLIYRNDSFYLNFRYTYKTPQKQKMRSEADSAEYNYRPGTRLLAVDQGQKADAVVAIMELTPDGKLQSVPFKPFFFKKKSAKSSGMVMYQWIKLPGGASFRAVVHAEKVRSQRRQKDKKAESAYFKQREVEGKPLPSTGKTKGRFLTRGQTFSKQHSIYIENCRELHKKTLPGVLFKLAQQNKCQGIVIEKLSSYKVTLKQDRLQNHRLMTWAMQKKTDFLKMLCDSGQMNLVEKSAAYTSQTCNRCESYGVRFNFPTKKEWAYYRTKGFIYAGADETPYPVIVKGGDWFLCSNDHCSGKKDANDPNSRYMIQSDANAARNLLLRAFRKEGWGHPSNDKEFRKQIHVKLRDWLKARYAKTPATVK